MPLAVLIPVSSASPTRSSLILRLPNAADVTAWDEFAAIYRPIVMRLARKQGIQAADAEDIVQEVFCAVARSVEDWLDRHDRGSFRAWLFRIARNRAVNLLTRRATRPIAGDTDGQQLDEIAAATELSDGFDLEYRREVFRIAAQRVRRHVVESTWQAFQMTHIDRRTITDVAQALGVSPGTVYISRSRVMSLLREMVRRIETEED